MDTKIFTVIIPFYNAEKTIERALSSLISSADYIKQVILVNDKSTDNTLDKIEKFKNFLSILVIDSEGGKGPGLARKTGMLAADSEWICFLDADDAYSLSALHYVFNRIQANENMVLLHCQSMYFENGTFIPENVTHSDNSCGGNFYNREFLINHNLFPHDNLFMAEDEFFNEKITFYIEHYCSSFDIEYYDYPTYMVHHDEEKSFSFQHWSDYLLKYHLLYKQYLVEDFLWDKKINRELKEIYLHGYVFAYFLFQAMENGDEYFDKNKYLKETFKEGLDFYCNTFDTTAKGMVEHFKTLPMDVLKILKISAETSAGYKINRMTPFKEFLIKIIN